MTEPDPRPGIFAVMWDCHGLEACERVPNPADTTFALLKGQEPPRPPNVEHWKLRARYNSQRHYEIYLITADPGITAQDIRDMFAGSPQTAADTIRRIGNKFYCNRKLQKSVVII
jgi:hypothetical protein